ncbi:LysE family translocator [Marinomonas agarivorans]|nr:LysE family translocator [Marinomonas agarivorans]
MSLESAITFFIAIFIFGVTPGPGIFAILARSMTNGAKACFSLIIGMIISDICYLVMACFGLAALATRWEEAFMVIRLLGAAYLLYLGWKMWTAKPQVQITSGDDVATQPAKPKSRRKGMFDLSGFIQGFLISGTNPKVIVFYIAFLPTFMDMVNLSAADIVLASVLTFFALLLGLMLIAIMAAQARRYLRSERSVSIVNRFAGSIMAAAGGYLGITA